MKISLTIPSHLWDLLEQHLFGTQVGGGAVIAVGYAETSTELRLLARTISFAKDGTDYVESNVGHHMLSAEFVRDNIISCRNAGLGYIAVHCHGGRDSVSFSEVDFKSHEKGYPALLDISGQVVGALVLAQSAAAGDIWLQDGRRLPLDHVRILGPQRRDLKPRKPRSVAGTGGTSQMYDRQTRLFGERGQAILSKLKVGIVGVGGVGSLLVEGLARIGVGRIVTVDSDVIAHSNLSRLIGTSKNDVGMKKVDYAERLVSNANPDCHYTGYADNIVAQRAATALLECDYLFLAADSMQARLVVNAIVNQYLIPGYQIGSKIQSTLLTGTIEDVFSVVRRLEPGNGCLWCNSLISPDKLQEEALSEEELRNQRYLPEVPAPSVITLNMLGVAYALNSFLFSVTGLAQTKNSPANAVYYRPMIDEWLEEEWQSDLDCLECQTTDKSRFAKGDKIALPVRQTVSGRMI